MRDLPRFGHTSNFAYLFASDQEEQQDYIFGLLFAGVFILAFFLVWSVLELVFMCLGKRKVGFLSGNAFEVPKESKKPVVIRSVFIIATLLLVTFSVLIVTKGLSYLYNTVNTMSVSARVRNI